MAGSRSVHIAWPGNAVTAHQVVVLGAVGTASLRRAVRAILTLPVTLP